MPWYLWLCLACLLVLPVVAVFAEDEPPDNAVTQEQEDAEREDPGPALIAA